MKRIIAFFLFSILAISCSTQQYMPEQELQTVLKNREFTFMARHANPTNSDVLNLMNSLPNSSSSRMLDLSYGYDIVLNKEKVEVALPYFGRLYIPSFDNDKNGFRFTSKEFDIEETEGKKGSRYISIYPKDVQHIRKIVIQIYKGGTAYVAIDANDRQPISYDGYIMKNEAKK